MKNIIPETHRDLLDGPITVVLSTVMPNGQPQSTPIWCNLEGDFVLINTMRQFRKAKNMAQNPKVGLMAYDKKKPLRNIEIRGRVVEMTEEGALEHLDTLNMLYTGTPHFFGDSIDASLKSKFTPVKIIIEPIRIRVEG